MASGVYPANVVKTYFFADAGSTEQLRFKELPSGYAYRFTFFASRNSGGNRTTTYKIGSQQVSLDAANNTNQTVTLDGLQPNASGELLLEMITPAAAEFGYLNSIILEAYDPTVLQAPGGLTAQATSGSSIQLGWQDNNSSETGYEVYRSTTGNGGFTKITTTAANATTFASTGLSESTTYYSGYGPSGTPTSRPTVLRWMPLRRPGAAALRPEMRLRCTSTLPPASSWRPVPGTT